MIDSPLADTEVRELVVAYRDYAAKAREARKTSLFAARAPQLHASMAAAELRQRFDLDADELLAELDVFDQAVRIATDERAPEFAFALRSVTSVKVVRHEANVMAPFGEVPEGARNVVGIPNPRQDALIALERLGAIEIDASDFMTFGFDYWFAVQLTLLGEILNAQLNA